MASHDLALFSEGNFYEEEKSPAPPLFEGRNYKGWNSLMETFIKKLDINAWDIAIARPADVSNKQERHLNAKAMHYIFCALSQDIFKLIYCFSSAYKVWKFLEEMYGFPLTGVEQTQELENIQACTNSQECLFHDESLKCTSTEREEEVLSSEEKYQEDDKETSCSHATPSDSTVKMPNPSSYFHILKIAKRKMKKLKIENKKLHLENKRLKTNNVVSLSCLSLENTKSCFNCNNIKELEREIICIKENNEKLCLENLSLKNIDCAKCKDYEIEIKEMDETFDEYRDKYEKHIESIVTTLKNSTIAYNKARHNLKTKNDELIAKINLLREIIKKNNQNIHSQNQDVSKSKLNIISQNINKSNNGNKRHQLIVNQFPKQFYHHHLQYSLNIKANAHKFPMENSFNNHYGNLTHKNNTKPQFEWRPKIRNETLTPLKMGHSLSSPQKRTRSIWVPKGTVTPGPLWIPKSLIH